MVVNEHEVIHTLIKDMGEPVRFLIYIFKINSKHEFYWVFAKMQYNISPHVLIGHNSSSFDMHFIMRRLEFLGSEMMEEFYQIATGKKMSYGEMFKYKIIRKETVTIAQGEDPVDYIYIKFDGTLFWNSMLIFQCAYSKLSSLNHMLDTLEIPSKIGISYKRISEIVNLAIEIKKIEDDIAALDTNLLNYHDRLEKIESKRNMINNDFDGHEGVEKLCTDILEYCFYDL